MLTNDSKIRYNSSTDWVQVYHDNTWKNWKFGGMNLDPTKMELTQDEFIAICGAGLQSYMTVGAIITLNNRYCNQFRVIGTNHDGTTNTVDIMPTTQVSAMYFGSSNTYYSSSARSWINSTYIDSFDYDIRELMIPMTVITSGTTTQDKAKLLSWREIGFTTSDTRIPSNDGGELYSVFTPGNENANRSRIIPAGTFGNANYWLRSRFTSDNVTLWYVYSSGVIAYNNGTNAAFGIAPVLRF